MVMIPAYSDMFTNERFKQGQFPFYIGKHSVCTTPMHHHGFVELSFVMEGSGTEKINGMEHSLQPGTVTFLLPHHIHEISCSKGQTVSKYCCMFDIHLLFGSSYHSSLYGYLHRIGTELPSTVHFENDDVQQLQQIFNCLFREYHQPHHPGQKSMICVKLTEALLLFVRAAVLEQEQGWIPHVQASAKQPFWTILHYVHIHFTESLSLKAVADHFNVSTTYVSRTFKSHTGENFLEYVHRLRFEFAASLLIASDMTIGDIAIESGFESFRTFSRVFQDICRSTPSEYRNFHRMKQETLLP